MFCNLCNLSTFLHIAITLGSSVRTRLIICDGSGAHKVDGTTSYDALETRCARCKMLQNGDSRVSFPNFLGLTAQTPCNTATPPASTLTPSAAYRSCRVLCPVTSTLNDARDLDQCDKTSVVICQVSKVERSA